MKMNKMNEQLCKLICDEVNIQNFSHYVQTEKGWLRLNYNRERDEFNITLDGKAVEAPRLLKFWSENMFGYPHH